LQKLKDTIDYDADLLREWGIVDSDGEDNMSWATPEGKNSTELYKITYNHWKEKLFKQASKQAEKGCYNLDISGHSLVLAGKPVFEAEGYKVTTAKDRLHSLGWEDAKYGVAAELDEKTSQHGKAERSWLIRKQLFQVPMLVSDLTKIVTDCADIDLEVASSILKDKFPYASIVPLTRDGTRCIVYYGITP
jgi:hypothetical protein